MGKPVVKAGLWRFNTDKGEVIEGSCRIRFVNFNINVFYGTIPPLELFSLSATLSMKSLIRTSSFSSLRRFFSLDIEPPYNRHIAIVAVAWFIALRQKGVPYI